MAPKAIVSYDDTPNDHDALSLGRVLADAGTELTLAYVRHSTRDRQDREQLITQGRDLLEHELKRVKRDRMRLSPLEDALSVSHSAPVSEPVLRERLA